MTSTASARLAGRAGVAVSTATASDTPTSSISAAAKVRRVHMRGSSGRREPLQGAPGGWAWQPPAVTRRKNTCTPAAHMRSCLSPFTWPPGRSGADSVRRPAPPAPQPQQRIQPDRAEGRGADAAKGELAKAQGELAGAQDQGDGH